MQKDELDPDTLVSSGINRMVYIEEFEILGFYFYFINIYIIYYILYNVKFSSG
jgi:hypothetical protein